MLNQGNQCKIKEISVKSQKSWYDKIKSQMKKINGMIWRFVNPYAIWASVGPPRIIYILYCDVVYG